MGEDNQTEENRTNDAGTKGTEAAPESEGEDETEAEEDPTDKADVGTKGTKAAPKSEEEDDPNSDDEDDPNSDD